MLSEDRYRTAPADRRHFLDYLGKFIRQNRIERKLSQKQLGDIVNVTDKSIFYYENSYRMPSIITVYALATVFGVTIDSMFPPTFFDITQKSNTRKRKSKPLDQPKTEVIRSRSAVRKERAASAKQNASRVK